MLVYLVRQLAGSPIDLTNIVTGVALTFVVSYAGTGFFVWYLLHLAEGELGRPKPAAEPESEPDTEVETGTVPESGPEEAPEPTETEESP